MSQSLDKEFGALRSCFWPIHRRELPKLIPMLIMLFFICFNYSILRNMKDSLVVTASGAEVIPFIKVWVMLPTAILLTSLFTKLSNRYSQERVFYIMISLFLGFFALFAFVLYPLREHLHPVSFADSVRTALPAGFKGMIAMCCNWTFTGFYVMSELWSTAIMAVLFWGFANEVTTLTEARRFYGVFGVGASCAAIFAGQFANYLSDSVLTLAANGQDPWEVVTMVLISLVIICGAITMGTFRWMSRYVLTDPSYDEFHYAKKVLKAKGKLSVKESFAFLSNSKYLICIAVLVVAYNLVIHMSEVLWKDQLFRLYPHAADYNHYMNNLTSLIGVLATLTALFMAKIIEKLGWTRTAMITPIMMAVTCTGFFSFLFFQENWAATFTALLGMTPLAVACFFGSAQNCLSKAAKYSVFDATKEMAFIPLGHEYKLKGKAAIDGVGSRIGKSGGSLMFQGLLMGFATVSATAPYVAGILSLAVVLWAIAVRSLGKQFNQLSIQKGEGSQEAQEEPTGSVVTA